MFAGISYEDAFALITSRQGGQVDGGTSNYFLVRIVAEKYNGEEFMVMPEQFDKTRKAIIQIPNIFNSGKSHFIFWDGEKIHDPSSAEISELPKIFYALREKINV